MAALLLVLSITACSNTVNDTPEQNITTESIITTTKPEQKSETIQANHSEHNTEENVITEEDKTTEKSDNKPSDKPGNSTTSRNPVTTTQKPQTTASSSKQLPNYAPEAEIKDVFNKVNKFRGQKGLGEMTLDPKLCKIAYIRAQEQKLLKGHTRPDNTKYYSALDEYNYSYMGCGENIEFISKLSPDEIFENWKDSSAHKGNILESRWTKSGIAMCRNVDGSYIIVQLFAC